jgi:NADH-quinone oxidoreductase subunit L
MVGVLLTALYTFRVIFRVFFGPIETPVRTRPGYVMTVPLMVLALGAIVGGAVKGPLLELLQPTLPTMVETDVAGMTETRSEVITAVAFLSGLYVAYVYHWQKRSLAEEAIANPIGRGLHAWWSAGWGFDWLYDTILVQPFLWVAQINKRDVIDAFYTGLARLTEALYRVLQRTQTGVVRWYAAGLAVGSVLFLAIVVFS